MARVRFINVYLGPLPAWSPAFLLSCKHNPDFEWLILSNQDPPKRQDHPNNVTFEFIDEAEIARRCWETLNIRYPRNCHPLKLTDLRPAYGLLFSDYLSDRELWGHCDLDLVWGDISRFVDDRTISFNDIITSRRHKITGHFTLYRNCNRINRICTSIPNFKEYCEEPRSTRMDETIISRYLNYKFNRRRHRLLNKMTFGVANYGPRFHWAKYLAPTGEEQITGAIKRDMCMTWNSGRTFDFNGKETMYLHFHKLKHLMRIFEVEYADDAESFKICRHGMFRQ